MPFVKDASIDGIQLRESSQVDVLDDTIKNEVEVLVSSRASMDIMQGCNAIKVINILTDRVENLVGILI